MSSGGNKREKELAAQNATAQTNLTTATAAYQPTPLETRLSTDSMNWLDFVEGKNGPVDYTKAPGLVNLGMYDEAATNRFAERTATGGLQMGADGANATAVALRKSQLADQMGERRGADLVTAVRAKDASVRGEIAPFLISTAEGRMGAKMASAGGQASSARSAYASAPVSTPWWQTALVGGLGAAGSYFSGGFAGGKS
jgi:hypothetical protein